MAESYITDNNMLTSNYRPVSVLPVFFKNIRTIDVQSFVFIYYKT